jgi:hypothetical protein
VRRVQPRRREPTAGRVGPEALLAVLVFIAALAFGIFLGWLSRGMNK